MTVKVEEKIQMKNKNKPDQGGLWRLCVCRCACSSLTMGSLYCQVSREGASVMAIMEYCAIHIFALLPHILTHSKPTGSIRRNYSELTESVGLISPWVSPGILVTGCVGVVARAWWALEKTSLLLVFQMYPQTPHPPNPVPLPSAASSALLFQHKVQNTDWKTSQSSEKKCAVQHSHCLGLMQRGIL